MNNWAKGKNFPKSPDNLFAEIDHERAAEFMVADLESRFARQEKERAAGKRPKRKRARRPKKE